MRDFNKITFVLNNHHIITNNHCYNHIFCMEIYVGIIHAFIVDGCPFTPSLI